jgi:hypothetical protein
VIDSNSVLFHFLLPSLFAAIFSAVLQGVGQSVTSASISTYNNGTITNGTVTYNALTNSSRDATTQGGFQMAGWGISIGFGAIAGLIIGLIYRCLNGNFSEQAHFFNDATLYDYPKVGEAN